MRVFILSVAFFAFSLYAVEGMWVPQQLQEIAEPLKRAGLELSPEELNDLTGQPLGAVVSLGFCTGSFISPQGLIATNHHCAYGGLQLNSTPEHNLIEKGFVSPDFESEISSGPNARIYVLDSIVDVTKDILAGLTDQMSGLEREHAIETNQKQLVADCEKEKGYRCQVFSFFGGVLYRLFKNLELKDIRVVYAPPSSIGNYGGEVDNWMWPRHTGDFSLIRAYVGKDGKPAPFAKDNVPYQNKHWLKVSKTPLREGDFVMVAGYPGRTNRYALADELANIQSWSYPYIGNNLKTMRDLVYAEGKANPDIAIKYAATVRSWENALKNYDGKLEGFKRSHALEAKRKTEKAMLDWLNTQSDKAPALALALDAYKHVTDILAQIRETQLRDYITNSIATSGLVGQLRSLYRLAIERSKPDLEREPGFQDRDIPKIEGALREYQNRYHAQMETKLLKHWLSLYSKLPAKDQTASVDAFLPLADTLYQTTKMGSVDERLKWLKASKADFEASADPVINLAVGLYPRMKALEDIDKDRAGDLARYRPELLKAVIAFKKSQNEGVYPDANGSLRITFGNVKGYSPKDAVHYAPFTTAQGVAAKATGEAPFNAPVVELEKIAARDFGPYMDEKLGTLPVNFLADLDITGGNSGSPVMNAKGELVGLAFDGNWESVGSDWIFNSAVSRTISVDARYVLWILDKVFPSLRIAMEIAKARAS